MPKYPASSTANKADNLAATNSPFSEISGLIILLIRSCETEEEITKSNPAAVDSAAAKAPAAKSAITQFGSWAISGFARTIISLSIVNSLIISLPLYWIMLSPFLSSNFNSPVSSHFLNGFQMNTHAIGDSTAFILLNEYNKVLSDVSDPRWRIEHSQVIDKKDFHLYNEKVLPSVQPTHATSDMYWAEDRLGERVKGAYAFKDLLKYSKRLALGTDFPVEKVNPFHTFYSSVARKDLSGYPESGFQMENSLSREETLKGMTIWGAYFNFEENEKGSLEPGKIADFILIDRDIMKVDIDLTPETKVLKTYVHGELVYSK